MSDLGHVASMKGLNKLTTGPEEPPGLGLGGMGKYLESSSSQQYNKLPEMDREQRLRADTL